MSVTAGDRILIYFRNKKKKMRDIFKDNAIYDAGVRLRSSSVGGDLLSIAGQSFFVMQVEVIKSEFNRKAISGDLSLSNVDSGPDGAPAVSEMKDEVSVPEQLWDTSSHTHYPEFYQ